MSRLGGVFSDRPLTIQWECQRASTRTLGLVGTLFEKTKLLHLPQCVSALTRYLSIFTLIDHGVRFKYIPDEDLDAVTKLRIDTETLNQQQIVAELELETLRRALLAKEVELREATAIHIRSLSKSNRLITLKETGTSLPVGVIMRIFKFLRIFGSAAKDLQRTPLYRIAEGFTDLPKWKSAIVGLIPIVLVQKASLYQEALSGMSHKQFAYLTRNPRLYELSNDEGLAKIKDEVVTVVLKVNEPGFGAHLEKAKQFQWHTLILQAHTAHAAREVLILLGERLWRLRSLEVQLERKRTPGGLGALFHLTGYENEQSEWASLQGFNLPPMPSDVNDPCLRFVNLPLGAIPHFAPLIARLQAASVVVPESEKDMRNVLKGLRSLPASLARLSVRHERNTSRDMRTEGMDLIHFSDLVELNLNTFEGRAMNMLLERFDCPSLRVLRASGSSVSGQPTGHANSFGSNMATKAEEAEVQEGFAEIAHKRFPELRNLAYSCSSVCPILNLESPRTRANIFFCLKLTNQPFLGRMIKRNDKKGGAAIVAPESAYLLPRLETLIPSSLDVDDVSLLVALASSRLRERSVSNLRSVRLVHRSNSILSKFGHGSTADLWYDCHVDAVRLLVPDVQFA